MRICHSGPGRAAAGALAAALLLGACGGTSGLVKAPFTQGVIGPGGGYMVTAHVELTIAPGALDRDRVLAILPQPDPLPIDPNAGSMAYLPGIMCIGPIGIPLLVDSRVSFCYEASAIPVGSTEADLVLLEWDEDAGFMRVKDRFTPGVTQDTVSHCLTDVAYTEIGHIGVAVRSGPAFDLVFMAGPPIGTDALPQGDVDMTGLLLAKLDGTHAPAPLPNTRNASRWIPSQNGSRILYRFSNVQTEGYDLRVSDVGDGTQRIVASDQSNEEHVQPYGSFFGWVGATDVVQWVLRFNNNDGTEFESLWTTGGSGIPPETVLYDGSNEMSVSDFRVSPDGTMILVRFANFFSGQSPDRLDVVDAVTGDAIATDLPLALSYTDAPIPRWLPDSSGLYGVDATQTFVERVDPDGAGLAPLYALPSVKTSQGRFLVDFAVAPSFTAGTASTTRCAYVRADVTVRATGIAAPKDQEFFVVDTLGGGQLVENPLGALYFVHELSYQPDGARVWVDLQNQAQGQGFLLDVALLPISAFDATIAFSATDASVIRALPFPISDMDLDRSTRGVVVYQPSFTEDADFPTPGLYLLSPDLQTQTALTFTGFQPRGPARFLRSWRLTPGSDFSGKVR